MLSGSNFLLSLVVFHDSNGLLFVSLVKRVRVLDVFKVLFQDLVVKIGVSVLFDEILTLVKVFSLRLHPLQELFLL